MASYLFYFLNGIVSLAALILGGFFGWMGLEVIRSPGGFTFGLALFAVNLIAWLFPALAWIFFFRGKTNVSLLFCVLALGWCCLMGFFAGTVAFGVANP